MNTIDDPHEVLVVEITVHPHKIVSLLFPSSEFCNVYFYLLEAEEATMSSWHESFSKAFDWNDEFAFCKRLPYVHLQLRIREKKHV